MKRSSLFYKLFPFVVMAVPWLYLAYIWNSLPQTIPTHFGASGKPDAFGSKNELFTVPIIFSVMGIFTYFLLRNIYKIDPKKKYNETTSNVLSKLSVVVIVLLAAVCMFIFYWTQKGKVEGISALFCVLSLFFAYIGNLMHSIKPNYFAGFRLPWTLENEDNWRMTHQLASKIWFWGGIALAIVSFLLPLKALIFVFMGTVFIMVVIPAVYSYNLYRRSQK